MARIARIVAPDFPHHIVQRGNRRQQVFFIDKDYQDYLNLLKEYSGKCNVAIVVYCLMPNHIHLIAIPRQQKSLAKAIGETHRRYTCMVNLRNDWRGYLWQGRFSSYILDEPYLLSAARYILLNPVRAGLVKDAEDYKWSSIRHYLNRQKNPLVKDNILKDLIPDWNTFLDEKSNVVDIKLLRFHERTGRPLGTKSFIERLESKLNITLKKAKPGPKKEKNK